MAALVEQKEAARLLGVSEAELKSLISSNEIFGYRDGPSWKFKMEELKRVAEDRGIQLGGESPAVGGSGIDSDLESLVPVDDVLDDGGDGESILVSEEELGASGIGAASTIIGKEDLDAGEGAADSDLNIAAEPVEAGASDVLMSTQDDDLLGDSKTGSGKGSDVEVVPGEGGATDLAVGGSDVIGDSALSMAGSDTDIGLGEGGSDVELEMSESLSIDDELSGSDALSLDDDWDDDSPTQLGAGPAESEDEEDDLMLGGESMFDDDASALSLGEDESIEIGSGAGSDVTLGSGDSGIGLANPTDSGLSLEEEPLELGGSQVGAMALGEDDMIELEEESDPEAATQLKADDDFLLTPVDDEGDEESDSGSQVIALDTEQFDESADTMLAAGPAVLEEDDFGAAPVGAGLGAGPAMMGQPMMHPAAQLPEAKYSIWNVLSLMLVFALMVLTGMLMVDVVQNMWQYDEPIAASGKVMEMVLSILPE